MKKQCCDIGKNLYQTFIDEIEDQLSDWDIHLGLCKQCNEAICDESIGKSIDSMKERCCNVGTTIYSMYLEKIAHNKTGYAEIDLHRINLGMTREQVKALLGEPDAYGGTSRKYKTPSIYKYGIYELTFESYKDSGLVWIMDENHNKIL